MAEERTERRAADGRVPGRRGLATRQRLLAVTRTMLGRCAYRNIAVVDLAKAAEVSPATFYQYFADVDGAILSLAEDLASVGGDQLAATIESADWSGADAYDAALHLADDFLALWDEHRPLLLVIDMLSGQGDERFRNVRIDLLSRPTQALLAAVNVEQAAGRLPADVSPKAVAGVLTAMLSHVASHRPGLEEWAPSIEDLRRAMANVVHWSLTNRPR